MTDPAYALIGEPVEDASLNAIQYLTPGLLGWAIASGATFGAALTLVSWRQKKILRRLRLAHVPACSVVGARVGVSIAVALVQTVVFIGIAILPYFGLRLSDYWWMVLPLLIVGTLAFLAIGLLAGAVAKTPESATAIANIIVLPMAFRSGAFFPLDAAPAWIRTVSNVFPLRHLVDAMQAVRPGTRAIETVDPTAAGASRRPCPRVRRARCAGARTDGRGRPRCETGPLPVGCATG